MELDEEDDFRVDSDYSSDYETTSSSSKKLDIPDIKYSVSNKTYRVEFDSPIDIFEHAVNTKNCILNANWRCTQHFGKFSVNIFKRNVWMLMTRIMDVDEVSNLVVSNFGRKPLKITVVNITIMVKLGVDLCLESLHDALCDRTVDIFLASNESFYFMDKQKFPALIAKPDKDKDLVLELYATGAINITGIKANEEIESAISFLKNRIVPNIQ